MSGDFLMHALLGLLPVICFLGGLVYLDSYRLVSLRWVLGTIVAGGLVAGASYLVNAGFLGLLDIEFAAYTRYVSPVIEEILKGLVILGLIRLNRIGFLVDAAIFGFAVGAGFAVVENMYFLQALPETGTGVWIVRGFGTAIMHGGATSIFAVAGRALISQRKERLPARTRHRVGGAFHFQSFSIFAHCDDARRADHAAAADDGRLSAEPAIRRSLAGRRLRCRSC